MISDWSLLCLILQKESRELYEELNRARGEPTQKSLDTARGLLESAAKLYSLVASRSDD